MKIKYKVTVTSPTWQAGEKDETKEVDARTAKILIKGNYAVEVKPAKKVVLCGSCIKLGTCRHDKTKTSCGDYRTLQKAAKKKLVAKKVVKKKVVKKT